mgnify:CR=1 FL=1
MHRRAARADGGAVEGGRFAQTALLDAAGALLARAERYRRMSVSIPGVKRDVVREHRDILDATLARRPEEAVQALRGRGTASTPDSDAG